jgi:hypothetical protein
LARNEGWSFYKSRGDDLGLRFIVGVFITLWGVSELLGDIYWWASSHFLWGIYMLGVGSAIVVRALQRPRDLK